MKQPIRILHFFGIMNRGGAESIIMNIYRKIDRNRIQFDFAVNSSKKGHYDDEIRELGGKIYILPRLSKEGGLFKYRAGIKKLVKENGSFHGFHSHVHHFSGWNLKIAYELNIPIRISHSHNTSDGKDNSIIRKIYRWYMAKLIKKYATKKLSCSRSAAIALYGEHFNEDSSHQIINNAIDLVQYGKLAEISKQKLKEDLKLPTNRKLIGHVGRFSTQKNHEFLIKIFNEYSKTFTDSHLVLVGDGNLRPKIEQMVEEFNLNERVHFLGVRDDVPVILNAIDLFMLPSLHEGIPVVLVEAQAAGLPCIVSNTITKEVDIGLDLINHIDLDSNINEWIDAIQKRQYKTIEWSKREEIIKQNKYEIESVIKIVEGVYELDYL